MLVGLFDIALEVLMTHVNRLPALVSLQHLYFQFANGETLLEDLTLSIDPTPTGIVGRNGCGKSILARLIAGELSPSCGTLDRRASVAFVPQAVVVEPGDTVASLTGTADTLAALNRMARGTASVDDLATIDERWDLADRLRRALDTAGLSQLSVDTPAEQLSGGQLARVAIIGALLSAPQLLVLDEPSNHLDSAGRTWLLRVLADWPGGLVVVSHDRQLLNRMGRIIELSPLGVRVYGGNYEAYRVQRDANSRPLSPHWSTHAWSAVANASACKRTTTACNAMPPTLANRRKPPTSTVSPRRAGKAPLLTSSAPCAALTSTARSIWTARCARPTSRCRMSRRFC